MSVLKAIAGTIVMFFGGAGAVLSLVTVVDPSSTQMADDLDPFGKPPPLVWSVAILVMSVAVIGLGAWLVHRSRHRTYANT